MSVKRYDLDEDAESAPRFCVAASDYDALRSRLTEAEALLREIREDAVHWGMPTTRIDAFLTRPPAPGPGG